MKSKVLPSWTRLAQGAALLFVCSYGVVAQPSAEILDRVKHSVVSITTYDADGKPFLSGTGFFIDSGRVITNFHVVRGAQGISIRTHDGRVYSVRRVAAANEKNDLAMLEMSSPIADIATLTTAQRVRDEGEAVALVSRSEQGFWTISSGVTTGSWSLFNGAEYIRLTAKIHRGNSGSPVVNDAGKVVGIATLYLISAEDLNFSVPASLIATLLPDVPKTAPVADVFVFNKP